jgi:hypothetical protein
VNGDDITAPLRNATIEAQTRDIVERVVARKPVEGDRVELKSTWPEAAPGARRIAAHANAARGDPILWVIGVDEKRGLVPGAPAEEFSNWWVKVRAQFDEGSAPPVRHLPVTTAYGEVVALAFDTDRPPYVVKNPAHGKERGDPAAYEVPWREGASTRSAHRSDLLRVLVPAAREPSFELRSARLMADANREPGAPDPRLHESWTWSAEVSLFIAPRSRQRIAIAFHHASLVFQLGGDVPRFRVPKVTLRPYGHPGNPFESHTIIGSSTELIVDGPGTFTAYAYWGTRRIVVDPTIGCTFELTFLPVDFENRLRVSGALVQESPKPKERLDWWLGGRRPEL